MQVIPFQVSDVELTTSQGRTMHGVQCVEDAQRGPCHGW